MFDNIKTSRSCQFHSKFIFFPKKLKSSKENIIFLRRTISHERKYFPLNWTIASGEKRQEKKYRRFIGKLARYRDAYSTERCVVQFDSSIYLRRGKTTQISICPNILAVSKMSGNPRLRANKRRQALRLNINYAILADHWFMNHIGIVSYINCKKIREIFHKNFPNNNIEVFVISCYYCLCLPPRTKIS